MTALARPLRAGRRRGGHRRRSRLKPSRSIPPAPASFPVDAHLEPLDDYYLWCDHRARKEAAEITAAAHDRRLEAIQWCGGDVFLRVGLRQAAALAAAQSGEARAVASRRWSIAIWWRPCCAAFTDAATVPRSICAMGHKWMWNRELGGLAAGRVPDGRRSAVRRSARETGGRVCHLGSHRRARLTPIWAEKLGLRAGIPIPVGAFDAHWDAIGAGVRRATWSTWWEPPRASWRLASSPL